MITDSVSKERYLLPTMQHACALIGVTFHVVCVSGGWLKYLSFQGAVTAGVVSAGLVSAAIENHQRRKVIEAKAQILTKRKEEARVVDPIDRYRGKPEKVEHSFPGVRKFSGTYPHFVGKEVFFVGATGTVSFLNPSLYHNNKEKIDGWHVSLGANGYAVLDKENTITLYSLNGTQVAQFFWGMGCYFSHVYDETNKRLYILYNKAIYVFTVSEKGANFESSTHIEGLEEIVKDEIGNVYTLARINEGYKYHFSIAPVGKEGMRTGLPEGFKVVKALDGKIYYATKKKMFVFDFTTKIHTPIKLPFKCVCIGSFDVRGDLIVLYDKGNFQGKLFNTKTQEVIDLGLEQSDAIQFCGEDTIATFRYVYEKCCVAEFWTFTPERSTSERSP